SNLVNLLELAPEVQEAVRLEQISLGHAKVLKGVNDRHRQISLCKEVIARGHSVRALEAILKDHASEPSHNGANGRSPSPAHTAARGPLLRRLPTWSRSKTSYGRSWPRGSKFASATRTRGRSF